MRRRLFGGRCLAFVIAALAAVTLLRAAEAVNEAFARAIDEQDLAALAQLAGEQVDLDFPGRHGKTALMVAARHGQADLVRRLLQAGAGVNVRSDNGGTALMFAALGTSPPTLDLLLSAGAEVNAAGGFEWTALMIATVKGDSVAVQRLLAHGAEVNRTDIYGWTPLMRAAFEKRSGVVSALLESPSLDMHARNEVGATALHLAALSGSADIVEALVSHGSSTRVEDDEGRTPAQAAAQGGHSALAARLSNGYW